MVCSVRQHLSDSLQGGLPLFVPCLTGLTYLALASALSRSACSSATAAPASPSGGTALLRRTGDILQQPLSVRGLLAHSTRYETTPTPRSPVMKVRRAFPNLQSREG